MYVPIYFFRKELGGENLSQLEMKVENSLVRINCFKNLKNIQIFRDKF